MNKEKQNIQGNVNYLSDDFIINNFEEVFNNVILITLNTIENIEIFIDSYLELNFVSDQIIKEINYKYAGINEVTDVLAFPYFNDTDLDGDKLLKEEFLFHPSTKTNIGEIFISLPTASKQSIVNNNSDFNEVLILTIHGLLHIFGYDHYEKNEKTIMQRKEKLIFDRVIKNV